VDGLLCGDQFPLLGAFRKLCEALEDKSVDIQRPPKEQEVDSEPFIVLTFDEVHTLTTLNDSKSWSCFGKIHRAIRGLMKESLFTLFLSTSVMLFLVTPTPKTNSSARMIHAGDVMLSFYELGFNQLAVHVNSSQTVSLSQVTSEERLSSYGRPLCVVHVHSIWLVLTFAIDGALTTSLRTTSSSSRPSSCWAAHHIEGILSQPTHNLLVLLIESLSSFSLHPMSRGYQNWRSSKSIPTCGSFSRLMAALRP
jgi:hypothetical protein